VLAGIFFGNALEWFDLVVFGYFAAAFGRLFFPADNQIASISLTFATFGITFLARPLGAVLIGTYADKRGRKAGLILSASLMAIGTAMIAALPTYAVLGSLAPVLLVFARTIQGLSAGGEFGSATTFLSEFDARHRGFFASLQFSSQGFTALLATCFGVLLTRFLSQADLDSWGWRVPFAFGVLIGPLAYVIRRHAIETAEFRPTASPLKDFAVRGKRRAAIAMAAVTLGTVVTYTIIFLPSYASTYLKFSAYDSFLGALTTSIVLVLVTPISGAVSDRLGRLATIAPPALILLVTSYPAFAWLGSSPTFERLLIVQLGIGLLAAWYLGALPSLMADLFPTAYRSTGLSVSYALAVTCFGGFAPLIITTLIEFTGSPLALSFYLMFAAAISLIGLSEARRIGIH
jgi:MHS family proline/betaine transporter-like MFS transporter